MYRHPAALLGFFFALSGQLVQADPTFLEWAAQENTIATQKLLQNISPSGTASGTVVASPSQSNPNYYYHWVRDAALTMNAVTSLYARTSDASVKAGYLARLKDYITLSRSEQTSASLGEPKFEVGGSVFTGPWGRPQNDGPALRAITLMRFAKLLLASGQSDYVRQYLYDGKSPTSSVIKTDLEYVSSHWGDPSFDLWEEVEGDHLYTRAVQRRALVEGAAFAKQMGDPGAAEAYTNQATALGNALKNHWNGSQLVITLSPTSSDQGKSSGLDAGVILAVLHGQSDDSFVTPANEWVMATIEKLRESFTGLYGVNGNSKNSQGESLGTAIGRYPEDAYDGIDRSGGNPWVLTTDAYAEYCYRLVSIYAKAGKIAVTALNRPFLAAMLPGVQLATSETIASNDSRFHPILAGLREAGDSFLRRVRYHANPDGSLSEEIDRDSGAMRGAHDLTWSYASFLSAWARRPADAVVQRGR